MAATTPRKKLLYMLGWMAQTDPPKEASKIKKNEWPVTTALFK